ncbi:hypothetical protein CWE09_12905 [Aliidiomarina minuta]|uniref:DUF2061 domain-containing protein n=1 Tax=Aliidiomarina minuta TaxID=880057 RepID=A0A432W439_9GAMM|nr:DUF2061 domain-containing protein [Aliidiomarina minuta]RUO24123.1 hypothetical protein CWE09_12905 [Aliidiomarina minuta]
MNKTFSFAVVHFTVAFLVTWLITGSWVLGGVIAMVEPAVNTVAYFFHEKAWGRIDRRRAAEAAAIS